MSLDWSPPEDLAAFWQETTAEAMGAPLDCHRSMHSDYERPGFEVETIRFRGSSGNVLNGWFAYPSGARRLPAFLWLPPYGRQSELPNEYGTRDGFASLSFNFHGETAFHREVYATSRGYFAEGAESPDTWIFRRMYMDAVIASRLLQAQVEVHENRIGVMGMSQGGGMSIWLGAWCPVVLAVCADMPFLGQIGPVVGEGVHRYPLKELCDFMEEVPLGRERVLHTASYFDTAFQARFCHAPTLVSLGLRDPAVRPFQARAVYEALPGEKKLVEYSGGHDWHAEMVASNRDWLLSKMPS